ncbi:hypothetical protein MYCTH_2303901 [Thermothelomyces thermophilus ATCC 42464]|uniref:PHD-type domain-containing protein n=1 Tax=Thermothelomyces thermophilus (strain ATCC 42464 / BCRC 31852 / DSM 1799) TaxID=573729 RepID=G2QDX6_THET4|nr:uncharacterized protein MYCTH_2303901 [Thermothelomyces thermophilus ATCC 42464]AEO57585.1 hypothetical protein MYCTH_2303901 [Thermothelomyces thermophilus ATCC 42464]
MQYSSAAAVAAAVVQSEGYKPREERGWEEFHPNLDIEATFMIYQADEVDGVIKSVPPTPAAQASADPVDGTGTPTKEANPGASHEANGTPSGRDKQPLGASLAEAATPSRRRSARPARESFSLYATRSLDSGGLPKIPKVLPISGQSSKERLDLKQPQYRRTNRIALFESKTFGQARYVDRSMMNVGYQESDQFIRPERGLIKATDANMEEEVDPTKADGDAVQHSAGAVGRVEYDMDEQDDMWLEKLNEQRKASDLDPITREIFEITITKIEKEWHALEKRIPKPNPKPPQTHRPRSSSAAAVNGEPQAGEEQDSKCAVCDDGDCENTNAIVFCDGCDLAVHQECYGVPFIPEGQWLCRKCQLIGRGIPTCIFCPNTDGAFKQTNSSKWAHLLCAMWIPEISLGNHTFMEPVMEVEKVPKTRWRLTCYICNQRMGACIQCSNKSCYQAFHVTCARRCRLYLKMKNSQGALAVLDGTLPLKAFCDKHCPPDYAEQHNVAQATKEAKRFYKRTMKGRIWADSQASALQLAATHRNARTEHPPDESQITGAKVSAVLADNKKKGQPPKNVWKLPSGAPIIPQAVFDLVESALARFPIRKRKDFVGEACKYWTLKREARRGAALLKRLQLQMETFSSMELTRRNFAAMGPSGKARLDRRVEFARGLVAELDKLTELCKLVEERERLKLEMAELEAEMVNTCYFPIYKLLLPVLEKAFSLDKNVFRQGLQELQAKMDRRYYVTTLPFTQDLCRAINEGINNPPESVVQNSGRPVEASPSKHNNYAEIGARRRLGKRIVKSLQPYLETALRAEAEITDQPHDVLRKELEGMLEASVEVRQQLPVASITVSPDEDAAAGRQGQVDVHMADAPAEGQIIVADQSGGEEDAEGEPDDDLVSPDRDNIQVGGYDEPTPRPNGVLSAAHSVSGEPQPDTTTPHLANGVTSLDKSSTSPPSLPGTSYSTLPPPAGATAPPSHHQPDTTTTTTTSSSHPLTPPRSNTGSASTASFNVTQNSNNNDNKDNDNDNNNNNNNNDNGASTTTSTTGNTCAVTNTNTNTNFLTHGGIPWYLAGFELRGTTAVQEQWTPGREAVRSLSEELTDMDDEALRDLEFDVDEERTITIRGDGVYGAGVGGADDGGGGGGGGGGNDGGGDDGEEDDGDEDGAKDVDGENAHHNGGGDGDGDDSGGSEEGKKRNGSGDDTNGVARTPPSPQLPQPPPQPQPKPPPPPRSQPAGAGVGNAKKAVAAAGSSSPRKRTRSEVAAAAAAASRSLRRGVRSSSRKK